MTDYLLKFPSKDVAIQFGAVTGLASQLESGEWVASTATHNHCLLEIGPHNNMDYWILYRDFMDLDIPDGADQFIYWSSSWKVVDDAGSEIEVPRPQFNPDVPNIFWL